MAGLRAVPALGGSREALRAAGERGSLPTAVHGPGAEVRNEE